jgi:hypothetical protein
MKPDFPSDAELDALALQVDEQLNALQTQPADTFLARGAKSGQPADPLAAPSQQAVIEQATGERFETFWQKYRRHLRRDLCLPGGLLYEQWHKWHDLPSKDAVRISIGVLTGMGIAVGAVPTMAVAATVFLLNVLAKAGIGAVCEGCAAEEAAREKGGKKAADEKH